ncbi:hypothetical protein SS50377_23590 [Spironucleus salmonicida]|uniref:Uncharacterized protein n=1 Tax=Spironucleus salmonicida TaxID=348837 RepID=V6LWE8_9EUKA|nr:hypothetical protein SS50377_23590 [Spironucleus salmonicida]|eukprot:EST48573.1 Hypothetical protein SS50377_11184 [Spironucleus salmonicida]
MSKQVFRQLLQTPKIHIKAIFDYKQIIVYSTSFSKVKVNKIVSKFIIFKEEKEQKDIHEYLLEEQAIRLNKKSDSIVKSHSSMLSNHVYHDKQHLQSLVNEGGWVKWYQDYKFLLTSKERLVLNAIITAATFEQQLHDSFPLIYK